MVLACSELKTEVDVISASYFPLIRERRFSCPEFVASE